MLASVSSFPLSLSEDWGHLYEDGSDLGYETGLRSEGCVRVRIRIRVRVRVRVRARVVMT